MFEWPLAVALIVHIALVRLGRLRPIHPLGIFPIAYLAFFLIGSSTFFASIPDEFSFGLFGTLEADVVPAVLTGYVGYVGGVILGNVSLEQHGLVADLKGFHGWSRTRARLLFTVLLVTAVLSFLCI